ncbi:MAG: hypothetical protein P4L50_09040 [Anaerolineaceae bacterium]|nr:hypothetical protein [Anaerolineaceae bacterium]
MQKQKLDKNQKINLWIVGGIGLVFFILLFFPNNTGAKDPHMLFMFSNDENMTYPIVVRMLSFSRDLHQTWGQLIIYGDYHYGYPFYFLSALVVLPVRLIYGANFTSHIQLNMLLLRQFISVLPMLLAAGFMVYIVTRLRSTWQSAGLFVLLITVPGIFRNDLSWWHPDALAVLAVVLTIFFLDRDHLRFGRNFYLAAFTCGLATAIKLFGLFFFLTIIGYLAAGLILNKLTIQRSMAVSSLFLLVMCGTIVLSNPFLFYSGPRQRMIEIQTSKSVELNAGYSHDDPVYYQKGPQWWVFTLSNWYGQPWFLGLLGLSLLAGCFWGASQFQNRLIFSWVLPYSIYVLYFVAPKPDQYWLPAMIPLFASSLTLPVGLLAEYKKRSLKLLSPLGILLAVVSAALLIILVIQLVQNALGDYPLYVSTLVREITAGY